MHKGNSQHITPSRCPAPKLLFFYFYFICTKIVLQEKITGIPPLPPIFFYFHFIYTKIVLQEKIIPPLIIFTNLANIFAYMTIIVRSMYNFVNCFQFNIRYEKVERPAPVGGVLVFNTEILAYCWFKGFSDTHTIPWLFSYSLRANSLAQTRGKVKLNKWKLWKYLFE